MTIYLDNAASTPCDLLVVKAMLPFFAEAYGNPSSGHAVGRQARDAVEQARSQVAELIGAAAPQEVIFTAGASEANNLAIKGLARARGGAPGAGSRGHLITSAVEHKAVTKPCRRLAEEGFELTELRPDRGGVITAAMVQDALRDDTLLVSIIWVNNELGTISEIPEIGALCRSRGVCFHTDATQAIGTLPVDVIKCGIDLMSWSGHKIHAPKGVGGLYVRSATPPIELAPLIEGGGHEGGRRAGTLNVPGIVGLGMACELCRSRGSEDGAKMARLRDRLEQGLQRQLDVRINGDPGRRAPHISNVCVPGVAGVPLAQLMKGVACSSGAAVTSTGHAPSSVLTAIGVPDDLALTALRLSLGRFTTEGDIDRAIAVIADQVGSAIADARS